MVFNIKEAIVGTIEIGTSITREEFKNSYSSGFHESCTRAYHLLRILRDLLEEGTPSWVALGIIETIEFLGDRTNSGSPSNDIS